MQETRRKFIGKGVRMNRIGIIGAMEIEVAQLKKDMENAQRVVKAGMEFVEGTLKGKQAVVVRSGVGKVNATACAQILADVFECDAVINTGIAGSLNPDINIGDIVISTDAVHYDVDAHVFGYAPGQVPQMNVFSFAADESLAQKAVKVCARVNPEITARRGRIASGDRFVADHSVKEWIRNTFHADCCEMEGAAIAQTCYLNSIPFIIVRAISDKADNSAQEDYDVFEKKAAQHSWQLVEGLMAEI